MDKFRIKGNVHKLKGNKGKFKDNKKLLVQGHLQLEDLHKYNHPSEHKTWWQHKELWEHHHLSTYNQHRLQGHLRSESSSQSLVQELIQERDLKILSIFKWSWNNVAGWIQLYEEPFFLLIAFSIIAFKCDMLYSMMYFGSLVLMVNFGWLVMGDEICLQTYLSIITLIVFMSYVLI